MRLVNVDKIAFPIAKYLWDNQYHIQKLLRYGETVELLNEITECLSKIKPDYDTNKVIEEMYAERPQPGFMSDEMIDFEGLVEIVKRGGVNESSIDN